MAQTLEEIADLAELIAEENITKGVANLEKIARKNGIFIHYDDFENYFTGMLQHENNSFDIFVNLGKNKAKKYARKYARTRFTIAHELGHFYIDAHRNLLKNGYSLSYDKELTYFSNVLVEKEANHFATNLLMPKERFTDDINLHGLGIEAVKILADKYKTSRTSTAIQYMNLAEQPCSLLFWDSSRKFKRKNYSESCFNLIKKFSKGFHINESIENEIFTGFDSFNANPNTTTSVKSNLSSFYTDVVKNSSMDMPIVIETMSLQTYGYVSLVLIDQ